ncbi:MAG: hypothetical protein R2875_13730 [Desulfobacterales bacterium]
MFWIFLTAMVFINFGRNGVMTIQSQYLFPDTGFDVSSRVLSYIFNTETGAIICFGLLAGRPANGWVTARPSASARCLALFYLAIYAFTDNVGWIYLASWFRGMADVIILAASCVCVGLNSAGAAGNALQPVQCHPVSFLGGRRHLDCRADC